jgi:serine/threonine-protein kinase
VLNRASVAPSAPSRPQTTTDDDDALLDPAPPSVPHADLFQPGEVLSDLYEIRAKVAESATGQVYAAWDRSLLRSVSIKATYPYLGKDVVEEARARATVRHASTMAVYEVGSHAGVQFMVMELVPGRSLESVVRARKEAGEAMPLDETIDVLARVADALAVVHRSGIAHRDVRPANVLLGPGGRVVLTDFGICQPEYRGGPGLEPDGLPHYLAPEAIRHTVVPGRVYLVDVYSLGVMAFELVAGRLPYAAACSTRLLIKHLQEPIPDPREARRDVPPPLADLIREMLAKDPLSRPQSMEEIAWRLRQLRSHRQSLPPEVGPSVLVVEQDQIAAARLASLIKAHARGAHVSFAADAAAAWKTVSATTLPDLVLMDPRHPAGGCADLLAQLARVKAAEPCIVVLVHGELSEAQRQKLRQWPFARLIDGRDALERRLPPYLRAAQARAARRQTPGKRVLARMS